MTKIDWQFLFFGLKLRQVGDCGDGFHAVSDEARAMKLNVSETNT